MDLFDLPASQRSSALRALKTVAMANGDFDAAERALLGAAARAYGVAVDADAIAPIGADELAAEVTEAEARRHVLQACMLMSLSDQSVSPQEVAVLEAFRRALGIDESKMSVMQDLAKGRLRFARLHAMATGRRGIRSQMNDTRLEDMLRFAGVLGADDELVARFKVLADLADGTLGREYVRYREANGFPWPGEKGGISEGAVHHDFTHVLTGYATDPIGEIEIGAFTAGMKKTDPFLFLFFPILEFHVGLAIRPGQPAFPGHYDAERAFRAHKAGSRCTIDLTDHWDFWSVVDRPVAELRARYAIAT
jgi:tellurite resistance protein